MWGAGEAGDVLDGGDAFVAGLVRQPGWPDDIADGVEARDVGGPVGVDDDVAPVDLHAQVLQTETLDIALDADGDNGALGLQRLCLAGCFQGDGHPRHRLRQPGHVGADAEFEPPLLERLVGYRGDFLILYRQDARQGLEHRNLGAQRPVETCEFYPDSP